MRTARLNLLCLAATILVAMNSQTVRAEYLISVADGNILAGGQLTLNIGIESSDPPETLTDFSLLLEITPIASSGLSDLEFSNPQSEAFLANPDYIFASTSETIREGGTTVSYDAPTQIAIDDLSNDEFFFPVSVPVTGRRLLATADVTHQLNGTAAEATIGDQYTVSVSELSLFFDENVFLERDFTVENGTITVAVPEPGSVAALVCLTGGCLLRRRRG